MSLTDINTSNLSPHLKNFVDDIISMTSNIVLKRADIANSYDDITSVRLSSFYKQILEGTDTLDIYDKIPYDALNSMESWKLAGIRSKENFPKYIEYGKNKVYMRNGLNLCYIGTDVPTNDSYKDFGKIYDGYISIKSSSFEPISFLRYTDDLGGSYFTVSIDKIIFDEESEVPTGYYRFSDLYMISDGVYTLVKNVPNRYTTDDDGNYVVDDYGIYSWNVEYDLYMKVKTFEQFQIVDIINNRTIPDDYMDDVLNAIRKYVINTYVNPDLSPGNQFSTPRYFGEYNIYYRQLNGLPPYNDMAVQPNVIMHDLLPNEYPDTSITKKLYDLTDDEVEAIKLNGKYDELFNKYTSIDYLKYMGKNRIDVMEARSADNFDILRIGSYNEDYHYDIFIENFHIAKEYILNQFYHPELFYSHEYYGSFISYMIVCQTMCQSIAHSDSILLNNLYTDEDTIRLKLESYGLNMFDSIPLIYRKNIAKNIENLIRNKGIDSIYGLVLDLFNVDDVEIYKYFYRKLKRNGITELSMSQVPVVTENFINEIIKDINKVKYDEITQNDIYWASYGMPLSYKDPNTGEIIAVNDPDEYIKNIILNTPFNYMNSKYISINSIFNLSKLNFNASYLMHYLFELSYKNQDIMMSVDDIEDKQSLFMVMIFLFALQAKRLKYDGNIQHDAVSVAYVLKYNLEQTVIKNGKEISIFELYKQYADTYYKYMIENVESDGTVDPNIYNIEELIENEYSTEDDATLSKRKVEIDNLSDNIKDDIVELRIPSDVSIASIAESYLFNSGLYGAYDNLIKLRDESKTYKDYECYNELLKAISISKINNKIFKIREPVWITVDNFIMWNEVIDNDIKTKVYNDYINNNETNYILCKSDGYPELSLGREYNEEYIQYCIDISTVDSDPKIYIKDYIVNSNITENRSIGNNNMLYIISSESDDDLNNKLNRIDLSTYVDPYCYDIRTGLIYKYLRYARTYQEYLYYENKDLYNLLQVKDDEYVVDENGNKTIDNRYYERLSELYTNIVITIENMIKNDELKNAINSSFTDLNLLTTYIKKVVNVFKSFEVDIATINILYEINDPNKYRIKTIDEISSYSDETHYGHFHTVDSIVTREEVSQSEPITIRDELDIEYYCEEDI